VSGSVGRGNDSAILVNPERHDRWMLRDCALVVKEWELGRDEAVDLEKLATRERHPSARGSVLYERPLY